MTRILLTLVFCVLPAACSLNEFTEEEKDLFVTAKLFKPYGIEYEPSKEKFTKKILPDGSIKLTYEYRGAKNKTGHMLSLDGIAINATSKISATALFYSTLAAAKLQLKSQDISLEEKKIPISLGAPMAVYSLSSKNKQLGTLVFAVFGKSLYYYKIIGADLGDQVWTVAIGQVESVLGK